MVQAVLKQLVDIKPGIYKLPGRRYQNVLSAQLQDRQIAIWFYCDPRQEEFPFTVEVYETGQYFENSIRRKFISTVNDNGYVLHVFEMLNIS